MRAVSAIIAGLATFGFLAISKAALGQEITNIIGLFLMTGALLLVAAPYIFTESKRHRTGRHK